MLTIPNSTIRHCRDRLAKAYAMAHDLNEDDVYKALTPAHIRAMANGIVGNAKGTTYVGKSLTNGDRTLHANRISDVWVQIVVDSRNFVPTIVPLSLKDTGGTATLRTEEQVKRRLTNRGLTRAA